MDDMSDDRIGGYYGPGTIIVFLIFIASVILWSVWGLVKWAL